MFFLYVSIPLSIIVVLFILIVFSFLEIHVRNLNFSADKMNEKLLNEDFKVLVKLKFLNKITIFKLNLNKEKLENDNMKENFSKIENKLTQNRNKVDINPLELLENLKISLKDLNLQVFIGIEDASINAIFAGLVSALISIGLGLIPQNENHYNWKVIPIYQNRNLLKINLDCIISLKLIHIIYTIYVLMRKGEKNGRTSDRRAYAYSNE